MRETGPRRLSGGAFIQHNAQIRFKFPAEPVKMPRVTIFTGRSFFLLASQPDSCHNLSTAR